MRDELADAMLARLNGNGAHVNGTAAHPPKPSKRPGWWAVLCTFIDDRLAGVSPAAACVWIVMFRHSRKGWVRAVAETRIASQCGLSDRHVRRCVGELMAAGLLTQESRGRKGKGASVWHLSTGHRCPVGNNVNRTRASSTNRTRVSSTTYIHPPVAAVASPATGGER